MFVTKVILRLSLSLFLAALPTTAESQIVPDGSLPSKVEQLQQIMGIEGGERQGDNLFHSFDKFSVPEGMEAIFENSPDIQNIFTRITGGEVSNLDGMLQTQGRANLFFINSAGIVFGENASLDIDGSFIATTADSVEFQDGTSFVANDNNPNVSLIISVPVGLQFKDDSGAITVNGNGNLIGRQSKFGFTPYVRNEESSGLSVPPGKTLALVGNGINFNGGAIVSEGAEISLGSVGLGLVKLETNNNQLDLNYENVTQFNNIEFQQNTLIDPSGASTSSLEIFAKDIALNGTSILLIQNENTSATEKITVNASGSLTIEQGSNFSTETTGEANASPIKIEATNILLEDQGSIISAAFDAGNSGDIEITSEKLEVINSSSTGFPGGLNSFTIGSGNAGNVNIDATEIKASQGSSISSSTGGLGDSGVVNINADSIELDGTTAEEGTFTFLGTISLGEGNAGNTNVDTANLRILNGAAISSDSSSDANAGSLNIEASKSIEILGLDPNTSNQSSINSSVTILEESFREGLGLPEVPAGNAGNVTITTPELNIADEGKVSVENQGTGQGGEITINSPNINNDGGNITAETASGNGGNVRINTNNLTSKKKGKLTTNAVGGDGGNITLTADSLIGLENSDITANAVGGNGGNINITANVILGFEPRLRLTEFSDIVASSELGIDGRITINTPDIDLQKELELSELQFVTTEEAIANSCLSSAKRKVNLMIGRSEGFPKNPDSDYSDVSFTLTGVGAEPTNSTSTPADNSQDSQSLIPAQKMVQTEDGRFFLVSAPQKTQSFFCY